MGGKKKSETPVPKLEKPDKSLKTPQPSKPVTTREKDSSQSFLLWMPEPIESLEVQIFNRKRLLETLDSKTSDIDSEIKQNFLIRDQQINSLNKTILGLRAELKSKEDQIKSLDHSAKIMNLQKQIKELTKDKEGFEVNMKRSKDEFEAAQANWEDERDSLLLQQEAVVEEQQALTSKVLSKDNEIKAVKDDIVQMGKIMADMTKLNHELHDKVQDMNKGIEDIRAKYLKAKAKAKIAKELEDRLASAFAERNTAVKDKNLIENKVKGELDKMVQDFLFLVKDMVDENNNSKSTSSISLLKLFDKAHEIVSVLAEIYVSIENNKILETDFFAVFKEMKKKEKIEIEQIIDKKIKQIVEIHEKSKKDRNDYTNSYIRLVEKQKEAFNELMEKSHTQLQELENKEAEIQKLKKKIINITGRLEKSKQKTQELLVKENEFKESIKNFHGKIEEMDEERKSTNNLLNVREKRVKNTLAQIQVLRDEIFNKDTELLKKNKEISRLEKFLDDLKGQVQQINSKMKFSDIEAIKNVNKEFEEKDKQIAMLKEMLRSSNAEKKAKENVISHFKRKSENLNHSREL